MVVLKQLAQSAAKGSRAWLGATAVVLACISTSAQAQDLLVRNATVHTASARGSLQNADVLVQGGIIRAVGNGLAGPAGARGGGGLSGRDERARRGRGAGDGRSDPAQDGGEEREGGACRRQGRTD